MQLFKPLKPIAFTSTQGEIHSVDRLKDGSLVIRKRDQSLGNNYYTYTTDNQGNIITLVHPISVLKIDRSFVSPIDTNGKNLEIIETIHWYTN
ncbi:MAG: hypothetical protein V7K26_32050 [Nostoc sp.]|uniref:hypothetical protein n=1 Tax=Nostoc sp. TaxID=1180 RepID=UPI002FF114DE